MSKKNWNYRVLRHDKGEYNGEREYLYMIHEVYYRDDNKTPKSWTADGVYPMGETEADMEDTFKKYAEALEKPILAVVGEGDAERLQEIPLVSEE